jgi:adenosine kinase
VSLNFLVDDLQVHAGGTGANVAYAAGQLGAGPVLLASVGADFDSGQRAFLEAHGVNTRHVRVSATRHTARFVCTTDATGAQIGSFYPGAMTEAADVTLAPVVEALGGCDAVIVSPDDPGAMLAHADECRAAGWPLWADPGQTSARFGGEDLARFLTGATYVFSNAYERELIERKTGWSPDDALARVGAWIVTRGVEGSEIHRRGEEVVRVDVVPVAHAADPTGAGDAFRGGFAAAHGWGLGDERCAQVGAAIASLSVESVGPQEYTASVDSVLGRVRATYGDAAADEIAAAAGVA